MTGIKELQILQGFGIGTVGHHRWFEPAIIAIMEDGRLMEKKVDGEWEDITPPKLQIREETYNPE